MTKIRWGPKPLTGCGSECIGDEGGVFPGTVFCLPRRDAALFSVSANSQSVLGRPGATAAAPGDCRVEMIRQEIMVILMGSRVDGSRWQGQREMATRDGTWWRGMRSQQHSRCMLMRSWQGMLQFLLCLPGDWKILDYLHLGMSGIPGRPSNRCVEHKILLKMCG